MLDLATSAVVLKWIAEAHLEAFFDAFLGVRNLVAGVLAAGRSG
jgi:hypothetical protein